MNVLVVPVLLAALQAPAPPERPRLARSADINDWTAYFEYGVEMLRSQPAGVGTYGAQGRPRQPFRADAAFYWASRLDPSRAEPLLGRWVAFWLQDIGRFEAYLNENPKVLRSPAVMRADSLYRRALERNPFVPQNLRILPYNDLPGRWIADLGMQGWLAYAGGDYPRALERFARLIARDPDKHVWTRYYRALAFMPMQQYDSAGAEMRALIATLRRMDTTGTTSAVYESKELVEYGIGLLAFVQGDNAGAQAAFERALQENLGFGPAHMELGDLATTRRDWASAAREYAAAVELAPDDPWLRSRYGAVLASAGRSAEAVDQLWRAIELEPYYADSYLTLGTALEVTGDRAGAIHALEDFLARAPRRATDEITRAQSLLATWRGGP
ncbi:MAG TPA: tetratricopeptide repeat protein [Gemmatimonadales bacterium]|nr:tetratricopeptide repeat protein [Gemmatimonadales bacterium]